MVETQRPTGSSCGRQYVQLLKKNYILSKRSCCSTCLEIGIPVVMFLALAMLRAIPSLKPEVNPGNSHLGKLGANSTPPIQDYCPLCISDGSFAAGLPSSNCVAAITSWCTTLQEQNPAVLQYVSSTYGSNRIEMAASVCVPSAQAVTAAQTDCKITASNHLGCVADPTTLSATYESAIVPDLNTLTLQAFQRGRSYYALASLGNGSYEAYFFNSINVASVQSTCSNICPSSTWDFQYCGCTGSCSTAEWAVRQRTPRVEEAVTEDRKLRNMYTAIWEDSKNGAACYFDFGNQILGRSTGYVPTCGFGGIDLNQMVLEAICGTGRGSVTRGANRENAIGVVSPDPNVRQRFRTYIQNIWRTNFQGRFSWPQYNCSAFLSTRVGSANLFESKNVDDYINDKLVREFSSDKEMLDYVQSAQYGRNSENIPLFFAVSFYSSNPWSYRIYTNDSNSFIPAYKYGIDGTDAPAIKDDYRIGFDFQTWANPLLGGSVVMFALVDNFIITDASPNPQNGTSSFFDSILFLPFPTLPYKTDLFITIVSPTIILFLLLAYSWPFARLVGFMVSEKEQKIRESLNMVGTRPFLFWLSYSTSYFIIFTVINILACLLLANVMAYTNKAFFFLFLTLWSLSLISLACILYALFSKSTPAIVASFVVLLLLFSPYWAEGTANFTQASKNGLSLLGPAAFAFGLQQILRAELAFQGAHPYNAREVINNYSLATAFAFLFFDSILYFFIAWYLEKVIPSEIGTHYPPWFLFMPSYWCGSKKKDEFQRVAGEEENPLIEPLSADLAGKPGVVIKGLVKVFNTNGREHVAVNGLHLTMVEGQLFVLLGHNGAGKTTTVNMLTGMLPVDGGEATVFDLSVKHSMTDIRKIMGICPQQNVLYPSLTVKEHVELYAHLKGVDKSSLPSVVDAAIKEVDLDFAKDQRAGTLSGGQKRRLLLAVAFLGDSRVVYLDEPTSGVDPASRRSIWDLLIKKKQGRVIILTTHFMDEADELGDRIGIMHHGQLKCCGTPLFLKSKYGVGYNLTISKNADCDPGRLISTINKHIPVASLLTNVGAEISFRLPMEQTSTFPALLDDLDSQKMALGIGDYGLSVTTMEEVFLRVATESAAEVSQQQQNRGSIRKLSQRRLSGVSPQSKELSLLDAGPPSSFFRQMAALLRKRVDVIKRDRRAFVFQLGIPLLTLIVGIGLLTIPSTRRVTPIEISTAGFGQSPLPIPLNQVSGRSTVDDGGLGAPFGGTEWQGLEASDVPAMSAALVERTRNSRLSAYGGYYLLSERSIVIYVNYTARHGMNVFFHAWANQRLANITGSRAGVRASAAQFPFAVSETLIDKTVSGIFASLITAIAFCFIPASYIVFVVSERQTNSKHLQLISGVNIYAYWLSNFVWDYLCYLLPGTLAIAIIAAYDISAFSGSALRYMAGAFYLYGAAVIPFTYLWSFLFRTPFQAQVIMLLVYIMAGLILMIVGSVLWQIESTKKDAEKVIMPLFRLFPPYCLGDSVFKIALAPIFGYKLSDPVVTRDNLIALGWETVVYFFLVIVVELVRTHDKLARVLSLSPDLPRNNNPVDEDVKAERDRIQEGKAEQAPIRLEGLRKTFRPHKVAVDDLWYAVDKGECFGFLGVNGAGKTTALRMLSGDEVPVAGTAYLNNLNIAEHPLEVRRLMGYCPQFDALHPLLTAVETLQFYGRIRGVPEERLNELVKFLCARLTLDQDNQHVRPCGGYSGGNKRKLSVAIALIGNPLVVFLDEPSTGMDPVSRRFMWDFISETMASRAVILTTHSMEECEALCHRIGIFVAGELKCLGTSQHLKTRFGQGFQLRVAVRENCQQAVHNFIVANFQGAKQLEAYGGSMKYELGRQEIPVSQMFRLIESQKQQVGIDSYSVGQTTLEQIFLTFADPQWGAHVNAVGENEGGSGSSSNGNKQANPAPPSQTTGTTTAAAVQLATYKSTGGASSDDAEERKQPEDP